MDSLSDDYNTVHNIAKPPFPYVPGNEFDVIRHHPPPAKWFGVGLRYAAAREREEVDVLTRCLRHPPAEGRFSPPPQESFRLRILDNVRAEDGKVAQLVTVRVLSGGDLCGRDVVAKFYDPLYYDHASDDVNPFLCADRQYAWETASYSRLSSAGVMGIPEYYGSYSLEIPVGDASRFIRLILIQKIHGITMNKLDPKDPSLSQHQRQAIMKGIIDIESEIYKNDIQHFDIHPRNVIVKDPFSSSPEVTIIDFGYVLFGRSLDPEELEEEQAMLPGTYISPRIRWKVRNERHLFVMRFKEWITWNWNAWLQREYKEDEVTDYMRSQWGSESTDVWPPGCE